jgi:hypothetical protein
MFDLAFDGWTPAELQTVITNVMRGVDTYAWLYTEELDPVEVSGTLSAAYRAAIVNGRLAGKGGVPGLVTVAAASPNVTAFPSTVAVAVTVPSSAPAGGTVSAAPSTVAGSATVPTPTVGTGVNIARQFNGTSNSMTFSAGNFNGVPFTYGTWAVIFRWNGTGSGQWREIISTNGSTGFGGLNIDGTFYFSTDGSISGSAFTPTANVWYCVIYTKATGSSTPRYNVYNYTTATWTSYNHGNTGANGSENLSAFYVGSWQGTVEYWPGDIAAMGFFRAWTPNDAAAQAAGLHTLASNWTSATTGADRRAVWILNQASTSTQVTDATGGGANETTSGVGTVTTDPAGFSS